VAPIQCQRATAYIQFIKYVFNSFTKVIIIIVIEMNIIKVALSSDRALLRTASGKPFQTRGAAAAKERC